MPVSKREINDDFADWLRGRMRQRGYDLDGARAGGMTRLAADADVSLSVISRALNEGRTPDLESLRGLGRALGVSLGDMLVAAGKADREELPVSAAPVGAGVDPDFLAEIAEASPATIEAVRAVLKATKG